MKFPKLREFEDIHAFIGHSHKDKEYANAIFFSLQRIVPLIPYVAEYFPNFGEDNCSSPSLYDLNRWILIECEVDFNEVENFTVSFQVRLTWNIEVTPSPCSNQIINQ